MVDALEHCSVVFVGNPLLDISVKDDDKSISDKYDIKMGAACLASPEQMPIYDELFNKEGREVIPGGSALNSARACHHIFKWAQTEKKTGYMGCLGKDSFAQMLEHVLKEEGVHGRFAYSEDTPTGTCAVTVWNKERALCANIGASAKFPMEHLDKNMELIEKADFVYSTGFFITSNFDAQIKIAKHCAETGKPFGFNLSAEFLILFSLDQVMEALSYADYVFCNEDEQRCIKEKLGIEQINKHLAKYKKHGHEKKPWRTVISTQGPRPTEVFRFNHVNEEEEGMNVKVPEVDSEKIVDTNGAGDSFVGAFFAALAMGKELKEAIELGNRLAGVCVQNSGCFFKGWE